jgi:integrase
MAKRRGQQEGSIYRMGDGRWRSAISLGWKKNKAGQTVMARKVFTSRTRGEVQKMLTKALRDRELGLPIAPERQTVAQFLQHWLAQTAKSRVRPSTYGSYAWIIGKHLVPGLGQFPLAKLSPQQVQEFLNDRLQTGRVRRVSSESEHSSDEIRLAERPPSEPGLAPRTVQHIHATLRAALDQALRWDLVPRNVAQLVDAPRVVRPEVKPFSPEQARKFLESANGDRFDALYAVAMLGLRQGEILGLQWPDIDLETGDLLIRRALQRVEGKLQTVETKHARSKRTLKLPQCVSAALVRHKALQEEERQLAGDRWKETGFVFTTSIGTPLDGPTVTHRFQAFLRKAELPRMRFHDLRHTCATLLLVQGVHPRIVMEILGHSQIAITMNLYSHVIPAMREEVATRLNQILSTPERVATRVATRDVPPSVN